METSQPAYWAGALRQDLTSFLILTQNFMSVHMNKRAGGLARSHWCSGKIDLGRWHENFPI